MPSSQQSDTPAATPTPTSPDLITQLGTLLLSAAELARAQAEAIRGDRADEVAMLESQRQAARAELGTTSRALAGSAALPAALGVLIRDLSAQNAAAEAQLGAALAALGADSLRSYLGRRGRITEADRAMLFAAPWDASRDVLCLIGAGAVALASELRTHGQRRILTVDPSRPASGDSNELPGSPTLLNLLTLEALEAAGTRFEDPRPEQMRVFVTGGEAPAAVSDIAAAVQRGLVTAAHARHDLGAAVPYYAEMAVRNLARIAELPSAASLRGVLRGLPVVVVAAGPSLDRNIAQLRPLAGRAVIIAMNQTARALVRAGVQPDIVLAIDPLRITYHFEGLPPGAIRTLMLGASVDPNLFELPAERMFTFSASPLSDGWLYELLGEDARVASNGTVANAALRLAAWLGCDPIVSVGRDLALDGDRYYADASVDGGQAVAVAGGKISFADHASKLRLAAGSDEDVRKMLAAQEYRLSQVPGFFGKPVTTTELFVYEIGLVRQTLKELAGQARFINATEGGAYLEGMDHMPLADVIARCPEATVDIQARLAAAASNHDPAARQRKMQQALRPLQADLDRVVKLAARAEALLSRPGGRRSSEYAGARRKLLQQARSRMLISVLVQGVLADLTEDERPLYRAIQDNVGPICAGIAAALPRLMGGGEHR